MGQVDSTSSLLVIGVVLVVLADVVLWALMVTTAIAVIGGLSPLIPAMLLAVLAITLTAALIASSAARSARRHEGTGRRRLPPDAGARGGGIEPPTS